MFLAGFEDASLGHHPMFEVCRCCRRVTYPPLFFGSALRFSGYIWWNLMGRRPVIQTEKVAFLRKQQMAKLRRRVWPLGARSVPELQRRGRG
jgi:hypothetical protein